MDVLNVFRDQKGLSDTLELDLETVANHHVGGEKQTPGPVEEQHSYPR